MSKCEFRLMYLTYKLVLYESVFTVVVGTQSYLYSHIWIEPTVMDN